MRAGLVTATAEQHAVCTGARHLTHAGHHRHFECGVQNPLDHYMSPQDKKTREEIPTFEQYVATMRSQYYQEAKPGRCFGVTSSKSRNGQQLYTARKEMFTVCSRCAPQALDHGTPQAQRACGMLAAGARSPCCCAHAVWTGSHHLHTHRPRFYVAADSLQPV